MRLRPLREVKVEAGCCVIPLSQGKAAICDAANRAIVSEYNWYAHREHRTFYAITNITLGNGRQRAIKMHRLLLGLNNPKIEVDHRDGNGLNNCRSNLRVCSRPINSMNRKLTLNSSSGFKGVTWNRANRKWVANLCCSKNRVYLGCFGNKELAALAYNEASEKYHGSFGKRNVLNGEVALETV